MSCTRPCIIIIISWTVLGILYIDYRLHTTRTSSYDFALNAYINATLMYNGL